MLWLERRSKSLQIVTVRLRIAFVIETSVTRSWRQFDGICSFGTFGRRERKFFQRALRGLETRIWRIRVFSLIFTKIRGRWRSRVAFGYDTNILAACHATLLCHIYFRPWASKIQILINQDQCIRLGKRCFSKVWLHKKCYKQFIFWTRTNIILLMSISNT